MPEFGPGGRSTFFQPDPYRFWVESTRSGLALIPKDALLGGLPTLTIDTRIGFRSAADRAAFADALTAAVLDLAARYHHDDGRPHRLVVAAHPLPEESA